MLNWNTTENKIQETINILKKYLALSPYKNNDPINCNNCLFRNIAILIVSGKIKINKINFTSNFFNNSSLVPENSKKQHGAYWHNSMINQISNYFKNNNFKIDKEPNLYYGRADIGIKEINLFIEIGTINLYKLYINSLKMRGCKILIIPEDNIALEIIL